MSVPILATKLYLPPPRLNLILRPRLIERINLGLHSKLTLISAPAGFGKTTLVSEWAAGADQKIAWISLDDGDNDPSRFLTYFISALQSIVPGIGNETLSTLLTSQPASYEPLLTSLLNEISGIAESITLVLDDYHIINSEPVDHALTYLLDHLPVNLHLMLTTREDPSLPLARYRARGQLVEIRAADLRFSAEEASLFLNQIMHLNLSAEEITALETRTEGWITGLQLAALSMQGHHDTASFIKSFTGSHRFVLDYLVEDVLKNQPERIRSFLLDTAILSRLCASLCNAVTGQEDGKEVLAYLERNNLFLFPLDDQREWYRYHHLFAEVLQAHLMEAQSVQLYPLHKRASQWYEQSGLPSDAIQHALAGTDFDRAARLITSIYPAMDSSFQSATWLRWVKKLPENVIRVRPVLSAQFANALTDTGDIEASMSRLQDAEECLNGLISGVVEEDAEQLKALPASIAMTYATNAQIQGDLSASVKYAKMALEYIPKDDIYRRAQATVIIEMTHWAKGHLEASHQGLVDWMQSMREAGNFNFVVVSAFYAADILVYMGRLREAEKTYHQALQLSSEHEQDTLQVIAIHHLGLALLMHEMGNDDRARFHLQKVSDFGERITLIDWPYRQLVAQARIKEFEGDADAALRLLKEASRVYMRNGIPDTHPIGALMARLHLRQGNLERAQDWVHERSVTDDEDLSYMREFEHITLARVLIAAYQHNQDDRYVRRALSLLDRLIQGAEEHNRFGSVIDILVTQALAHQTQSNFDAAFEALERALTLAEPEGYLRTFVEEGEPMQTLLSNYRNHLDRHPQKNGHPLSGYVTKLLLAFIRPEVKPQPASVNHNADLIEPLNQRELKILQLIAEGLSNQIISQRLFLALSTVKGHNRNIFNKLQVQNRTEAVARARELGLL